jgi:hypothetical protein
MFFYPTGVIAAAAQYEEAKQRIKETEAKIEQYRRANADTDIIDVEARVIEEMPLLPAPTNGDEP